MLEKYGNIFSLCFDNSVNTHKLYMNLCIHTYLHTMHVWFAYNHEYLP